MTHATSATDTTISINLFGAFRDFGDGSCVTVAFKKGMGVDAVKAEILASLGGGAALETLLSVSRLATEKVVLLDTDTLEDARALSILPPVAGG